MSPLRPPIPAIAAVIALLGLSACKPQQQAAEDPRLAPPLVLFAKAAPAGDADPAYTGLVAARVQSDLGFRVPGKVTRRLVDTGQTVTEGQPLLTIDPTDYVHALTSQIGDAAAAKARWVQAAADERRYRGLVATGAVAQQTYDQAKAASDSAKALLDAAEAQEKVARNQNDYAVLRADADGTVVETLAEPGQVVSSGQIVVRLAHAGPREAVIDLPETVRPAIGSGAEASLYGGAIEAPAKLRQLSDAADPRTRTFEARYVMASAGASAPLGATVTLRLDGSQQAQAQAVAVPLGALDDEGGGPGVWVLDAKTSQVSFRPVRVTTLGVELAVLGGGVRPGERVVAMGGHFLHEGERVGIADEKASMQ
jgi:RND family efflux transporter MFP subunit